MIITRKLGKIFRGKATPAQLMMAAIIGTTVGFMPGLSQAPGLLVLLFLSAVILNANLALMGVCLLVSALISFPLLPVTFRVGRLLLDGPLEGFFSTLINAPVLALFGFEYYATTGGLVVGLLLGSLFGYGTIRAVQGFRRKMVALDQNSEGWKRFHERRLVKLFVLIFIGGSRGKLSYEDLLAKKGGSPFRPLGLVCAGLIVVAGFVVSLFAGDAIVGYAVRSGLEQANGATVDLERAELRLSEGRMTLAGLAMADPNDLGTDLFRAERLEADISQADLWRKRIHIERLHVSDASSGETRDRRGSLNRPLEQQSPPVRDGEAKTFEDYLRDAEKWRERLAQVADWLDRFSGPAKSPDAAEPGTPEDEDARERRLYEQGYRNAVASHLVRGSPTVLVSLALVEKMRVTQMPDETLEIKGENLSTHPALVEKAPRLTIRSSGETLLFDAQMAAYSKMPAENVLELAYLRLPVDTVAGGLKFSGEAPMKGGTLDFYTRGSWTASNIDMPVQVTLRKSRLSLAQAGATDVEELMLPIGVTGSFRNPRIHFTDSDLADALAAAGKAELARRVNAETEKVRNQAEEKVGEELRERTKGLFDGRLPGRDN